MSSSRLLLASVASLSVALGCSGTVVTGDDGEGGDNGGSTTSSTSNTGSVTVGTTVGVTSTTTGGDPPPPIPCDDSADCGNPGESVCVFSMGTCAPRCGPASPPCPPSTICEECATGSCPGCRDCVAACLPFQK